MTEEIANSPEAKTTEDRLNKVVKDGAADPLAELGVTPAVAEPDAKGAGKVPKK